MNSKIYSNIKILLVAVAVIITSITYVIFFQVGEAESFENNGIARAIIIDQLHEEFPNEIFQKQATNYLETAGYEVDIVTTKDVTVDFYKNLPEKNYKIVVIRTHGADNDEGSNVVLFTGEKYQEDKYIQEQLFGQVTKAAPLLEVAFKPLDQSESNWIIVNDTYRYLKSSTQKESKSENEFFAISPKLVSDSMRGKFNDTVFLLGGCNTLSNPSMAEALVRQGASEVFGWNNEVGNADNDFALLFFLEQYLINDIGSDQILDTLSNHLNPEKMSFPASFHSYTKS